jgi:Haem-binding uptake, Tiki superfamily, ChaN
MKKMFLVTLWLLCPALAAGATGGPAADRYAEVVDRILGAWKSADVVCLGEDHGRRYDSDLRLSLVRSPAFPNTARVVVVEFANPVHQALLDHFILDGAPLSREELAAVWRDANGAEVWESPIYEDFLRAVQRVNSALPRDRRIRVLGGDSPIDWSAVKTPEQLLPLINRGGNIRNIIAGLLDSHQKVLAIYGAGHCDKLGGGFPGDLAGRYPAGRMWSIEPVIRSAGAAKAKALFGLAGKPAYVVITGTKWAQSPAPELTIAPPGVSLGEVLDAVIYHGDVPDEVVKADLTELNNKYAAELARRSGLTKAALELWRQQHSPKPR